MWENKVRAYLKDNRISQEAFAESLNVTQGWLSHKLTGKRKATVDDLSLIAAQMGVSITDLVDSGKVKEDAGEYRLKSSTTPDQFSESQLELLKAYLEAPESLRGGIRRLLDLPE